MLRDGVGISTGDSVAYLQMAEAIRNYGSVCIYGVKGKLIPIGHWPPGYPLFLMLFNPLMLNLILFSITNFVIYFLLKYSGAKHFESLFWVIFISLSPTIISVFTHVWSEALFIPLMLLTLYFLLRVNKILIAPLLGFLPMVRYSSIFMLPLVFIAENLTLKLKVLIGFLSTLPLLVWKLRDVITDSLVWRDTVFHPPMQHHIDILSNTVYSYLGINWLWSPHSTKMKILVFTLVVITFILLSRKYYLSKYLSASLGFYGIFLTLSVSFYDHSSIPDIRIMAPAYISFALLYALSAVRFRWLYILVPFTLYGYIRELKHYKVSGYNLPEWKNLDILKVIPKYSERPIYSNAHDLIWWATGVPSGMIPRKYEPHNARFNPNFHKEIKNFYYELRKDCGLLVWVDKIERNYYPNKNELINYLNLVPLMKTEDGSIWIVKDCQGLK